MVMHWTAFGPGLGALDERSKCPPGFRCGFHAVPVPSGTSATVNHRQGRLEAAERRYEEALALYDRAGTAHPLDHANALRPMALLRKELGDLGVARPYGAGRRRCTVPLVSKRVFMNARRTCPAFRNPGGIPSIENSRRVMMKKAPAFSERTERLVLAVIVTDLLLQGAETVPAFAEAGRFFFLAGVATWLLFTIEWVARIRRAENWRTYAFSFIGIVDFLAILPLWLFTGFDLKALRAFRLFRLLRSTVRIASRSEGLAKMVAAFRNARDEAGVLVSGTAVVIVTAGMGMYHLENRAQPEAFASVLDGMWWAVITLTTVGYGDLQPVTGGGKVLATVAMFAGIGVIGAACGIMADALREVGEEA